MNKFLREFFESIDTPGGHLVVSLVVGLIGIGFLAKGFDMATTEPLLAFLTAAAILMRGGTPKPPDTPAQ